MLDPRPHLRGDPRPADRAIGDPSVVELAYNKHPLYFVGPWNLSQRFLMHGLFTEYLYGRLEELRLRESAAARSAAPV